MIGRTYNEKNSDTKEIHMFVGGSDASSYCLLCDKSKRTGKHGK